MALPEGDASVACTFAFTFDGVKIQRINEISGLKMEQDVIELKQNTDQGKYEVRKLPGRPKPGEVTLTRGLTGDNSFAKWIEDSRFGKMDAARKGGEIQVYDHTGEAITRYQLVNAWPKSLEVTNLQAGGTSVAMEKLIVTYDEMKVGG